MSVTLETYYHRGARKYSVRNPLYTRPPDVVEFPSVIHGSILPDGPGFPYSLDRPMMSFKTYRAMCNAGLKHDADRVYTTRFRSTITPDNLWAKTLEFGSRSVPRPTGIDEVFRDVYDMLRDEFDVTERILPMEMEESLKHVPSGTSPGLPWVRTHPGWKKGDVFDNYLPQIKAYWDRVSNGKPVNVLPDCAAFARSHISKVGTNKVRPIWAYPAICIAQESRFSVPIQQLLKKQEIGHRLAYGMETLRGGMTWLHYHLLKHRKRDPGCKFLMTDYTAFDSSIPAWLIRDCFYILREKFILSQQDTIKFKRMVDYFINTTIQNMDGRRFRKSHGIPSGTMFTNILGSMCNFVITHVVVKLTTGEYPMFVNCFGDDSIVILPGKAIVNLNDIAHCSEFLFGTKINAKKSKWTNVPTNVQYLGYYNFNGSPVKHNDELIASMLYPQHVQDDWAYCVARALGCLLASAGASTTIFLAAQSVYRAAGFAAAERGLKLVKTNPRMLRHLGVMGCADWDIGSEYFMEYHLSNPRIDCTKIAKGVTY